MSEILATVVDSLLPLDVSLEITLAEDIYGTPDMDLLTGTNNSDRIFGLAGDDQIEGEGGGDYLSGDEGDDLLFGSTGQDTLIGGDGDDFLDGGNGKDFLDGGNGDDILNGGEGKDILTGGAGADQFVFKSADAVDSITDFTSGVDKIVLAHEIFSGVTIAADTGAPVEFAIVDSDEAAATTSGLIVYNSTNGNLFYNQNGTEGGLGTGALFASLSNAPAISATDFMVQSFTGLS